MSERLSSRKPKFDVVTGASDTQVECWYYNEPRQRDLYVEITLATGEKTMVNVRLPR